MGPRAGRAGVEEGRVGTVKAARRAELRAVRGRTARGESLGRTAQG